MMSEPIMKVAPKPKCKSKTTVTFRVSALNGPKGNFSLIFTEYKSIRLLIGSGAIYVTYLTVQRFVISLFDTIVLNLYNIYYTRLLFQQSLIKTKVFHAYESEAKNPLVAFYDTPGKCWGYSYKTTPTGLLIFFYVKAYAQSLYDKICRKIKSAETS